MTMTLEFEKYCDADKLADEIYNQTGILLIKRQETDQPIGHITVVGQTTVIETEVELTQEQIDAITSIVASHLP